MPLLFQKTNQLCVAIQFISGKIECEVNIDILFLFKMLSKIVFFHRCTVFIGQHIALIQRITVCHSKSFRLPACPHQRKCDNRLQEEDSGTPDIDLNLPAVQKRSSGITYQNRKIGENRIIAELPHNTASDYQQQNDRIHVYNCRIGKRMIGDRFRAFTPALVKLLF